VATVNAGSEAKPPPGEPPGPVAAPTEAFERLDAAGPGGRTVAFLSLLESHPGRPPDLAARDGLRARLDGLDLSRTALEARIAAGAVGQGGDAGADADTPPPWWDPELRGVRLARADLRGARLGAAVLRHADLRRADLRDASLGNADLRGARLEEADLRGADLAGADLRGASLGNADLRGTMLEDAKLCRAALRFARLEGAALDNADLRRADLWGADLSAATVAGADLRGAVLKEATLRHTDLKRANLRRVDAGKSDFFESDFSGADLRGATLSGARFARAVFTDAQLQNLDLSTCDLAGVHVRGAAISGTRLRAEQFAGAIGEENVGAFGEARKGYLALERYFEDSGDPDAASWAYRRRRRMQKLEALASTRAAKARGDRRAAAVYRFHHLSDQLVEWLCDYGESIPRVMLTMFGVYLMFTVIYGVTGGVVRVGRAEAGAGAPASVVTRDPLDLAVFSLMAVTGGNTPAGMEPRNNMIILLSGVEGLTGVALTGLLGFVMGNLVRR